MQWKQKEVVIPKELQSDLDPVFARLLAERGIVSKADRERFFSPDYDAHIHDPFLFTAMPTVVKRVKRALKNGELVGVFGDFDADGVTGSATLRHGLEDLGLKTVVHIPHKEREGHGLSIEGIEAFEKASAKLVFTVDCGISNRDEIALAREKGIDVIVIDHHHIPEVLPPALACINPKMPESGYPFRHLCGAGTAFKVLQGLYRELAPEKSEQLKWLLDLVAVGTVADVMPLVDENRILVKYGLIVLSKTRRAGLQELFDVGRILVSEQRPPTSVTIGFQIAPRINAAGRMAHARIAHDLLFENDRVAAREIALTLERHNTDRRKVSEKVAQEVRKVVRKYFLDKKFILSAEPHYPLGIVGLVAGKIADEFARPTAILQRGEKVSKGSFRSVPGVNVIEIITACGDMLLKFGGHEQAAGMTIENDKLDAFYKKFHALVDESIGDGRGLEPVTSIDAELELKHITLDFVDMLSRFAPFGEGNPEPVFLIKNAVATDKRFVGNGEKHLKMTLQLSGDGKKRFVDAIWFGAGERALEFEKGDTLDIVGTPQENVWNGNRSVQIEVKDVRRTL